MIHLTLFPWKQKGLDVGGCIEQIQRERKQDRASLCIVGSTSVTETVQQASGLLSSAGGLRGPSGLRGGGRFRSPRETSGCPGEGRVRSP